MRCHQVFLQYQMWVCRSPKAATLQISRVGNLHVNPRFLPTNVWWDMELTWKIPTLDIKCWLALARDSASTKCLRRCDFAGKPNCPCVPIVEWFSLQLCCDKYKIASLDSSKEIARVMDLVLSTGIFLVMPEFLICSTLDGWVWSNLWVMTLVCLMK